MGISQQSHLQEVEQHQVLAFDLMPPPSTWALAGNRNARELAAFVAFEEPTFCDDEISWASCSRWQVFVASFSIVWIWLVTTVIDGCLTAEHKPLCPADRRETAPVYRWLTPAPESPASVLKCLFFNWKQAFSSFSSTFRFPPHCVKLQYSIFFDEKTKLWPKFASSTKLRGSVTRIWNDVDLLQGRNGQEFLYECETLWDLTFGNGIQLSVLPKGSETAAFIVVIGVVIISLDSFVIAFHAQYIIVVVIVIYYYSYLEFFCFSAN